MIKKIKKYAKFIVCMALIMGLMAPSYAALSASDGSAFVTKAEFDSALADFNARLTTFEAGINSKIDSQVTSYLDRNGIWSGKSQIINDSTSLATCLTYGPLAANLRAWAVNICKNEDGKKDKYWNNDIITKTIVTNITKTGLAYLTVRSNASANYIMQWPSSGAWPLLEGAFSSFCIFNTIKGGIKQMRTAMDVFKMTNGYYGSGDNKYIDLSIDVNTRTVLFFVDKEEELQVIWRLLYNGSLTKLFTLDDSKFNTASSGFNFNGSSTGYPADDSTYKNEKFGFVFDVDVY